MNNKIILFILTAASCCAQTQLQNKPTATTPAGDDWLLLQGATNGQRKLDPLYYRTNAANTLTGTQTVDAIAWNPQAGGTIAGAGTLTINSNVSAVIATFSGSTATIALPTASGTRSVVVYALSTYNSGSQTITVPSLIRSEADPDTATTTITIPASTGAYWRVQFNSRGGTWTDFNVVGDTLSSVDDTAYNATSWDAVTTVAPSKNAVRDRLETLISATTSTESGTHASPTTTNPLSPTWSGPIYSVWYGATGTINLPAASGYSGRGILVYNTGAFTVTIDSNGSEVIVRDGTVQTGGVSMTLSSGAGNYVALISDGNRWITLGFKGTLAAGS